MMGVNGLSTNEQTKERETKREALQLGKWHALANKGSPHLTTQNQAIKLKTIIIRAFVMLPSKPTECAPSLWSLRQVFID